MIVGGFMEVKFGVLPETEFGLPDCRVDDGEGIDADPNPGFVDELGAGTGAGVWCRECENAAGFPP